MPRIKDNKERTMTDAAEEVVKRYGLNEMPNELEEQNRPDVPIERDYSVGEKSMIESYFRRHPQMRPAPKPLLKNLGQEVAPGVRAGEIIERLQAQLESLSGNSENLKQKLDDLELRAKECDNPACRARGTLHIHQGA